MLTLGSGRNLPMISPVVGLLLFLPACLSIKMILRQPAQPRVDGPDCCDSSAKSVVLAICTWLSRVAFNLSVLAREPSLGNGAAPLHSPERGTCDIFCMANEAGSVGRRLRIHNRLLYAGPVRRCPILLRAGAGDLL